MTRRLCCSLFCSPHLVVHVDIDIDDLASRHGGGGGGGSRGGCGAVDGVMRRRAEEEKREAEASITHTNQTGVRLTK